MKKIIKEVIISPLFIICFSLSIFALLISFITYVNGNSNYSSRYDIAYHENTEEYDQIIKQYEENLNKSYFYYNKDGQGLVQNELKQENFEKYLSDLISKSKANLNLIKSCITSDMGNYYEHQMAQKTDTNHKYVPWVVVNGEHDVDAENQIIESLIDYVCGDDKTYCYSN